MLVHEHRTSAGVVTGGCRGGKVAGQNCRQFGKEIAHVIGVQRVSGMGTKSGTTTSSGQSDHEWHEPASMCA